MIALDPPYTLEVGAQIWPDPSPEAQARRGGVGGGRSHEAGVERRLRSVDAPSPGGSTGGRRHPSLPRNDQRRSVLTEAAVRMRMRPEDISAVEVIVRLAGLDSGSSSGTTRRRLRSRRVVDQVGPVPRSRSASHAVTGGRLWPRSFRRYGHRGRAKSPTTSTAGEAASGQAAEFPVAR